jgi:hypothetical protein
LIRAPKLITLRVLDITGGIWLFNQDCPFPSVQKLHVWSYEIDAYMLDNYLSKTPSIKEVYLVHSMKMHIPMDALQLKREGVTLSAYIYSKARRSPFSFNFGSKMDFETVTPI